MPIGVGALGAQFGEGLTVLRDSWGGGWSRGTMICAEPVEVVENSTDPLAALEEAVAARPDCLWAGYISYDAGRTIEKIPDLAVDDIELPLLRFCAYPAWVTLEAGEVMPQGERSAGIKLAEVVREVLEDSAQTESSEGTGTASTGGVGDPLGADRMSRTFSRERYEAAVREALEHIWDGDFYQVNLSQRFSIPLADPGELADNMIAACPAPYGAYIDAGEFQVVSASPELLLQVAAEEVRSCPIKGTRPRSRIPEGDDHLAKQLASSEKDLAENLMIVDLIRNDLGKVCALGSIEVDKLWLLSSYATVHHLVSVVTGELATGVGLKRIIEAVFPGGSVTGAPKVAAMKFIEETEPFRRGIYTGSIGWIGPASDGIELELNIAIRTVVCKSGWAHLQVGGGIVADSVPALEYKETLDKAAGIADAMGIDPAAL